MQVVTGKKAATRIQNNCIFFIHVNYYMYPTFAFSFLNPFSLSWVFVASLLGVICVRECLLTIHCLVPHLVFSWSLCPPQCMVLGSSSCVPVLFSFAVFGMRKILLIQQ